MAKEKSDLIEPMRVDLVRCCCGWLVGWLPQIEAQRNHLIWALAQRNQIFFVNARKSSDVSQYYWVVYVGRKPEIYMTWEEAEQVDGYPKNKHEKFKLFDEAQEALCKFHEDSNFGNDIGRSRTQHEASVGAST